MKPVAFKQVVARLASVIVQMAIVLVVVFSATVVAIAILRAIQYKLIG